jgi:hypothetical protein
VRTHAVGVLSAFPITQENPCRILTAGLQGSLYSLRVSDVRIITMHIRESKRQYRLVQLSDHLGKEALVKVDRDHRAG